MPQVVVGLDKWLDGQKTLPSIVARIHPLDVSGTVPAELRSIMIPAGRNSGVSLDLPAGRYLFEAYLPNGDVATETATVVAGTNAPVHLRATDSPHEWLSWQHLVGQKVTWAPSPSRDVKTKLGLDVVAVPNPTALPKGLMKVWDGAPAEALDMRTVDVLPRPYLTEPLTDQDLNLASYLFDTGPWQENGRYFAWVKRPPAGPPLLAVLPLPWHQADHSGNAPVDVLIDASDVGAEGRRESPVRASVVVRDNVMASVFGYLESGDLPAAARIVRTATDMLFQKVENPLAAAGGAYVLVRSEIPKQRPMWVDWLQNLRNWFTWLPDGAILDGWADLNGIGRPQNVGRAAEAFVDAFSRGLPFYSAGVRLLFEGLTRVEATLASTDWPPGLAPALEFARRLALRIDVRQPFSVVRLR